MRNAKIIHVVVNTDGGVGAADWRMSKDDLPSYEGTNTYYRIEVPQEVPPAEITEVIDCFLGDDDPPETWNILEVRNLPNVTTTEEDPAGMTDVEADADEDLDRCASGCVCSPAERAAALADDEDEED